MPAAPLSDGHVRSRPRVASPADRARPRAPASIVPASSKLKAARAVGLTVSMAGAVAALLLVLILVAALATGGRGGQAIVAAQRVADGASRLAAMARTMIQGRFATLGFQVGPVHLQGASAASRDEILQAAAIKPGDPIWGIDLNAIRARVEAVGWVQRARVIRLLPDTLVIAVDERPLMAIWQHAGRRDVIVSDGHVVASVRPDQFKALPLIVGEGANDTASSLLPLVMQRPRLAAHLRAIRRVDHRRWDLLLKDGGVVQLDAADEAGSLARLDRLDRASRILDLGYARIDLRNPDLTVVRPRGGQPRVDSHGV